MTVPLATSVAVPPVIFVGCLVAGVFAAIRLLPELPGGVVAGVAFFVVCGLLGMALALTGLHVFLMVETPFEEGKSFAVAAELTEMGWQVSLVLGVAALLYTVVLRARGAGATPQPAPTREP